MEWELVTKKIKDLKAHNKNPRKLSKNDYEQLAKSMDKFGLIDKPIINIDGKIIGGHQRIAVLKKEGVKSVECWQPKDGQSLSAEDTDELNIRLNRNQGEWDWDILANEWELDLLIDFGFTPEQLAIGDNSISTCEEDESEKMEPPKNPKTKLGDLYEMGDHRLICGDSTNGDVVTNLLKEETPILMVTDPPYGVNYDPKQRKTNKTTGKVKNDDTVNWSLAWHLFPGSVVYVWHAAIYCAEVQKNLQDAEFETKCQIIWCKQHLAMGRGDYHWQHEPCWYAVKKGHKHNWQGSRKEATIWEISNLNSSGKNQDDERTAHSTQKPLECMARPIRNNTAEGEGVYDPFLGSGTTLLAAEQLKRRCYAIELDPAYCDISIGRWIRYRKLQGLPFDVIKNGKKTNEFE